MKHLKLKHRAEYSFTGQVFSSNGTSGRHLFEEKDLLKLVFQTIFVRPVDSVNGFKIYRTQKTSNYRSMFE